MFKTYDSNENPFMPTLHSAFDDLSCDSKVSPRESIEVRAICLFDQAKDKTIELTQEKKCPIHQEKFVRK